MSGAPLRLTPPPDYTKTLLPLTVGLGLTLVIFSLTRSTLPAVGDSSHSLPHGGWYRDGTKLVHYHKPQSPGTSWTPILLVLGLSAAIYVSHLFSTRSCARHCPHCGAKHTESA
uniref:TGB2 n=1 Tax=Zygocactus virus X TaxID=253701 RepID=A0A067XGZ1_9VIRU|nr:TGB2 [Zygocactus virus X]